MVKTTNSSDIGQLLESLPTPDVIRSELTASVRRVRVLRQLLKVSERAAVRPPTPPGRRVEVTSGR
jgi:hypothetical protein